MTPITTAQIATLFSASLADAAAGLTGLAQGTRVLTLDGALPVEYLLPGDRVITRDAGVQTLRAISITVRTARMIRICQNALGNGRPGDDMVIAPDQPILVRDWRAMALFGQAQAMVPAKKLVDGHYIRFEPAAETRLFALQFDAQHVIYAEGLELGSAAAMLSPAD